MLSRGGLEKGAIAISPLVHGLTSDSQKATSRNLVQDDHQHDSVLFFSRGKGRGHAVPDVAIAHELRSTVGGLDIRFASYSVGAVTLRDLGEQVVDLDLPEDNLLWESTIRIINLIQRLRPRLVVSHEEFCVPPLCHAVGIPNVFLTDWFTDPKSLQMQALKYADQIVFLDEAGIYDEPEYPNNKVSYAGCVLRPRGSTVCDRLDARARFWYSG